MSKVLFENVCKVYDGEVLAVDNFNLEIQDREFVVLVGPSGCGKSTTLRMVAGLEEITSGKIFIGESLANNVPPKDRDIAMVFQNYALYPHMTVYDNMAFGLKLRKMPKSEIQDRVNKAADLLSINELLHRKPKALSGGQRQRVAVGRAIVRNPKVFLFDEPLSNLDAKLRVQMRAEISKLHNRLQTTMIYVTHDQIEAMTMGERIVVMKDGLVHQVADPITLYDQPVNKFVAGFIGNPPMNFINGTIQEKEEGLCFVKGANSLQLTAEQVKILEPFKDKKIILGIRPESIFGKENIDRLKHPQAVQTKIELIEPMGSEIYLYLNIGEDTLVARVEANVRAEIDEEKEMFFNMDKIHFFDNETEETLV